MKPKFAFALITAIFFISGCKFPNPSPPADTLIPTPPPALSATSEPTVTESPTDASQPTSTATYAPSSTPIFGNAEIFGIGWLGSGHLLITVEIESKIEGEYYALVCDTEFNCRVSEDYENRLYCLSNEVSPGEGIKFILLDQMKEMEVFETRIDVPPKPAPTSSSGGGSNPTQEPPPMPTDDPE